MAWLGEVVRVRDGTEKGKNRFGDVLIKKLDDSGYVEVGDKVMVSKQSD